MKFKLLNVPAFWRWDIKNTLLVYTSIVVKYFCVWPIDIKVSCPSPFGVRRAAGASVTYGLFIPPSNKIWRYIVIVMSVCLSVSLCILVSNIKKIMQWWIAFNNGVQEVSCRREWVVYCVPSSVCAAGSSFVSFAYNISMLIYIDLA